jgi:hypothetical protein
MCYFKKGFLEVTHLSLLSRHPNEHAQTLINMHPILHFLKLHAPATLPLIGLLPGMACGSSKSQ